MADLGTTAPRGLRWQHAAGVRWRRSLGDVVVLGAGDPVVLNATAALLWESLAEPCDVEVLTARVASACQVSAEEVREEVADVVAELARSALVEAA